MPLPAGTSTKALFKGVDTWKKETVMKKVEFPTWFLSSSFSMARIVNEDFEILFSGSSKVRS